ncbi:MAG TPA: hypothetical protein PKY96_02500 [Flavobacteriales bacterium]|nr:hypothetical protein [Flavobacteriales bacterium]
MRHQRILIGIVLTHMLLLALYTFPHQLVPERLRIIGQLYARPLFHQQWRLFAPDPPLCACQIESSSGGAWSNIDRGPDHYLERRTVQSIARHVQAEVQDGRTAPAPELVRAMRSMCLHNDEWRAGYPVPEFRFRLVEHCVADAQQPGLRDVRITELLVP